MMTATKMGVVVLTFCAGFACLADNPDATERVRLIAGLAEEKAYLPRFHAIRALEKEAPLSDAERSALLAFLRRADGTEGTDEMELAALKNDVTENLLRLPDMPGGFARDLLDMQADAAQSATWRNYCVQFLGRTYSEVNNACRMGLYWRWVFNPQLRGVQGVYEKALRIDAHGDKRQ